MEEIWILVDGRKCIFRQNMSWICKYIYVIWEIKWAFDFVSREFIWPQLLVSFSSISGVLFSWEWKLHFNWSEWMIYITLFFIHVALWDLSLAHLPMVNALVSGFSKQCLIYTESLAGELISESGCLTCSECIGLWSMFCQWLCWSENNFQSPSTCEMDEWLHQGDVKRYIKKENKELNISTSDLPLPTPTCILLTRQMGEEYSSGHSALFSCYVTLNTSKSERKQETPNRLQESLFPYYRYLKFAL